MKARYTLALKAPAGDLTRILPAAEAPAGAAAIADEDAAAVVAELAEQAGHPAQVLTPRRLDDRVLVAIDHGQVVAELRQAGTVLLYADRVDASVGVILAGLTPALLGTALEELRR